MELTMDIDELVNRPGYEMNSRKALTPNQWMSALIGFQCLILVAVPYAFSLSPPLDVVEGLVWAPHWLIGTYKHPPLPAWLIEISVLITRDVILGPYVISQLCVALTYWFIYRLARHFVDPITAAASAILMAGSYYFTVPTLEFNHNVVQLPLWSGALLLFAQLRKKPQSWSLWMALGAIGGFGLYGKYTFAILLLVLLALALYEPKTRAAFATIKPYASFVLAGLIFLPHLKWLVENNFEPFSYAMERTEGGATASPLIFTLAQMADHLPMLLIFLAAGLTGQKNIEKLDCEKQDQTFLRLAAFGPIMVTLGIFLATGAAAKDMWGMPMFTPLGLWLVVELGHKWSIPELERATFAAMTLILLVGIGFIVQSLHPYLGIPPRSNWPMRELADNVDMIWKEHTDKPLGIVAGAPFIAGLASIGHNPRPPVMIGRDVKHSPWIEEKQIAAMGIIYLSPQNQDVPASCGAEHYKNTIRLSDPLLPDIIAILCPPKAEP